MSPIVEQFALAGTANTMRALKLKIIGVILPRVAKKRRNVLRKLAA